MESIGFTPATRHTMIRDVRLGPEEEEKNAVAIAAVAVLITSFAHAQTTFLPRPVRMVIAFTAASETETISRVWWGRSSAPAAFERFVKSETEKLARVVRAAGVKPQ